MKIPTQPKDNEDNLRMYRIPIRCEDPVPEAERYIRAPYILSDRLNRPRRSKCHTVKVA